MVEVQVMESTSRTQALELASISSALYELGKRLTAIEKDLNANRQDGPAFAIRTALAHLNTTRRELDAAIRRLADH
jgi:hypothetical protein